MDIFKGAERLMTMDDETWLRHANPWSVWTRFTCLPLLVLAIWSRVWLGWWSLLPTALALLWTWYNPRAFKPATRTDNWGSKGTFGERIFLDRKNVNIPDHHLRVAKILTMASALGGVVLIYGLVILDLWVTTLGVYATVIPKMWFIDRMVWIYEDLKDSNPQYASWLKTR